MKTVNALKVRNNLGEILDDLERTQEPILISKGRKIRAALVTIQDFDKRFVDVKVEEEKKRFLERVRSLKQPKREPLASLTLLRALRGY